MRIESGLATNYFGRVKQHLSGIKAWPVLRCPRVAGFKVTTEVIAEAKTIWATVKPAILDLGRVFVKMKKTFSRHKRNLITKQTYTDAVAETGVPYSTAEFYRRMATIVDDPSKPIDQDKFLALYDAGLNLASDRFTKARDDARVASLDPHNARQVEDLVKALKTDYPIPPASDSSLPGLAKRIGTIRAKLEGDEDPVIRETLEEALHGQQEIVEELEQSCTDKLSELVQMLGGESADDQAFPWAQAAQETIKEKLTALKLT